MFEELAKETGASVWAIASMLFFLGAWTVMALKVWRARPEEMAECARLPLADDSGNARELPLGESPRA
jgi:cbb3-type cytochrome oxidase subunit 3